LVSSTYYFCGGGDDGCSVVKKEEIGIGPLRFTIPPWATADLSTDTSSSLYHKEKELGVGESLAELQ
jgi:hypothetical protein